MASFLEKLKKGMNIKEMPDPSNNSKEGDEEREETLEKGHPLETVSQDKLETKDLTFSEESSEQTLPQPAKNTAIVFASAKVSKDKKITVEKRKIKKKKKRTRIAKRKEKQGLKKKKITVKKEEAPRERKNETKKEKGWFEPGGQLVVDVYQTEEEIVIQSAIAGVRPEDLDISIENDVISIKGRREKPIEKGEVNYFYSECYWGYFSREIILPAEVDGKRAEATIKNGILTIRLPKIEREKKKKIIVKE